MDYLGAGSRIADLAQRACTARWCGEAGWGRHEASLSPSSWVRWPEDRPTVTAACAETEVYREDQADQILSCLGGKVGQGVGRRWVETCGGCAGGRGAGAAGAGRC